MNKKRVAILATGGGSNLQALLDAMKDLVFPAVPVMVFLDKA
jgi:folate-dependent phosphoribosylglycinamide formyltransferase PurN